MGTIITTLLGSIFKQLIMATLSERVAKVVVIGLGNKLVTSTKNDLDDKVWAEVKKKLEG